MKLLKKQQHAIYYLKDKTTKEIIYGGAAGGGKTALGCLWLIESCQKYSGSRWLMGRSKLKTLKATTLKTFFELSKKLEIDNQFTFNAQKSVIEWDNGSEIVLKDCFFYPSDPEFTELGGLELTGAFIDEIPQVTYKAWNIVMSRIRFKLKEFDLIPKILGTCNPNKGWSYRLFYVPDKNGELIKKRKFIQALPTDNHHLPESYLQTLLELDKNSRERLYFGNWEFDDDPSALIEYDAITAYFNGNHVIEGDKTYLTIDVARKGKDKTVFRVWKGWKCVKRISFKKSLINEIVDKAKELQVKYKIPNNNTIADEDGVGGGVVDYLGCNGFINNSRPLLGENYTNLKTQCSILMAKKINNLEVVEVCDDAEIITLISDEMAQIKYDNLDKDTKLSIVSKDKIKQNIGRSPDDWDSIMMRYWFELCKEPAFV